MALSGLYCPYCKGNLHDEATKCYHCQAPIGKKQWKMALANMTLELNKDTSTWKLFWKMLRIRFWLWKISVKRLFRPVAAAFGRAREALRRRIATV